MATRLAYPDVPLFRYPHTALSGEFISSALRAPALAGPTGASGMEELPARALTFAADDARITLEFQLGRKVSVDGAPASTYGALTLDHLTLVAFLVPGRHFCRQCQSFFCCKRFQFGACAAVVGNHLIAERLHRLVTGMCVGKLAQLDFSDAGEHRFVYKFSVPVGNRVGFHAAKCESGNA